MSDIKTTKQHLINALDSMDLENINIGRLQNLQFFAQVLKMVSDISDTSYMETMTDILHKMNNSFSTTSVPTDTIELQEAKEEK